MANPLINSVIELKNEFWTPPMNIRFAGYVSFRGFDDNGAPIFVGPNSIEDTLQEAIQNLLLNG